MLWTIAIKKDVREFSRGEDSKLNTINVWYGIRVSAADDVMCLCCMPQSALSRQRLASKYWITRAVSVGGAASRRGRPLFVWRRALSPRCSWRSVASTSTHTDSTSRAERGTPTTTPTTPRTTTPTTPSTCPTHLYSCNIVYCNIISLRYYGCKRKA